MFTTKVRTIIAMLAATFAVAIVPAVSQAAVKSVTKPGATAQTNETQTPSAQRAVRAGTTNNPPVVTRYAVAELDAGSAGIPGYDDKRCQELLRDYNLAVDWVQDALLAGDSRGVDYHGQIALHAYAEMSENCLVVD